jgi:hypothetical protein
LKAALFLNASALIIIEKIANAINLGSRTASTALVEYNKDMISRGNATIIVFAVLLSDSLLCALGVDLDMQIIVFYLAFLFITIYKYSEAFKILLPQIHRFLSLVLKKIKAILINCFLYFEKAYDVVI